MRKLPQTRGGVPSLLAPICNQEEEAKSEVQCDRKRPICSRCQKFFSSATITKILALPTTQTRGMARLLVSLVPPRPRICLRLPEMQRQLTLQPRESPWGHWFCQSLLTETRSRTKYWGSAGRITFQMGGTYPKIW
jgi:hypothetical protein